MGELSRVLNNTVNLHTGPTEEKIQSTLDSLNRLITELERPQNRELMRFVVSWQKLEQELDKLQRKIQERMAERPTNKINEFLQRLKKKN
jgi:hypothetical protein